jgi:hypothetical protein
MDLPDTRCQTKRGVSLTSSRDGSGMLWAYMPCCASFQRGLLLHGMDSAARVYCNTEDTQQVGPAPSFRGMHCP